MNNDISLSQRFDEALARTIPNKPFLKTTTQTASYEDLINTIQATFRLFQSLGLKPGDSIGVIGREAFEVSVLALASLRWGLGCAILNPAMLRDEIETAATACELDCLFVEKEQADPITSVTVLSYDPIGHSDKPKSLLAHVRSSLKGTNGKTLVGLSDGLPSAEPQRVVADETVSNLLYTSGTTGQSKVVELDHKNIAAQLKVFDVVYDYSEASRILNPLPLHFTDGYCHGPLVTFFSGATLFRPTEFDLKKIDQILNSIGPEKITHFIVVPTVLAIMARLDDDYDTCFSSDDFKFIRSSGDSLPSDLWRSIEERFGTRVVNTYGMSETVCEVLFSGPANASREIGTVGQPTGCFCSIVDNEGQALPNGEIGELLIKGSVVTRGYRGAPELTANTIVDGWLKTGDLATIDAKGFVKIEGRIKELIISGGVNISPRQITECLLLCPGVFDAVAYGVAHPVWGEQIAAAVVATPGSTLNSADVISHCQRILPSFKVPRIVNFVDVLPRNSAGKVIMKALKKLPQGSSTSTTSSSQEDVSQRVVSMATQIFGTDLNASHLTTPPEVIAGWDSFAHLTLITKIEDDFSVTLTTQEVMSVTNLEALIKIIRGKV